MTEKPQTKTEDKRTCVKCKRRVIECTNEDGLCEECEIQSVRNQEPSTVKLIGDIDFEEGTIIECICGIKMFVFYGSEKQCTCGRKYKIKPELVEVI